ncbi:MAG TPA: hypothetical protein VMP11_20295 [Verrucomicrobiae bacterium]|nr:hypothetical protein [Verrucomicrobiae bacterium]
MIKELAAVDSPRVVYDIRRDAEGLKLKQEASLKGGWGGLETTNGQIGMPECWSAGNVLYLHVE